MNNIQINPISYTPDRIAFRLVLLIIFERVENNVITINKLNRVLVLFFLEVNSFIKRINPIHETKYLPKANTVPIALYKEVLMLYSMKLPIQPGSKNGINSRKYKTSCLLIFNLCCFTYFTCVLLG